MLFATQVQSEYHKTHAPENLHKNATKTHLDTLDR